MPRQTWTPSRLKEAHRRYEAGETSASIGASLGVSSGAVTHAFRKRGLALRKPGRAAWSDREVLELYRRYLRGESSAALAAESGRRRGSLIRAFADRGYLRLASGARPGPRGRREKWKAAEHEHVMSDGVCVICDWGCEEDSPAGEA